MHTPSGSRRKYLPSPLHKKILVIFGSPLVFPQPVVVLYKQTYEPDLHLLVTVSVLVTLTVDVVCNVDGFCNVDGVCFCRATSRT